MERTTTFAASATLIRKSRHAFTLVELLVVIGIIVVIASIGIPMGFKAYRAGERARTQADLNSITVALEAFRADWGDYPRPDSPGQNCGFATLGRYLIGPGGAMTGTPPTLIPSATPYNALRSPPYGVGDVAPGTGTAEYVWVDPANPPTAAPTGTGLWIPFSYSDSHDGPGMKKPVGGRVYGPYLQPDKFKTRGLAILDRENNPILYFPGSPGKPQIHKLPPPATNLPSYMASDYHAMYYANDNEIFFRAVGDTVGPNGSLSAIHTLQTFLGDNDHDGLIGIGETEATTAPFLLWSAGPDGIYGPPRLADMDSSPQDVKSCDDVTNFR